MACACKSLREFEKENGEPMEETVLVTGVRYAKKVAMFILAMTLGIVLTPIIILWVVGKMTFGGGGAIKLPKKLIDLAKQG